MRLEPRIAPGSGRGGQRRRSARGLGCLCCGVADAAMGGRADAALGSACGRSGACRGASGAARAGDADRAADRPMRRPWWSVAAIRARPRTPRLRRRRYGHGPTVGRGWRLAAWSQQGVPRRAGRASRRRCGYSRGPPAEAAVVIGGGDPRAPRLRASIGSSGATAVGRADAADGGPRGRSSALRGATDAPRDGDIPSRRDRPQRQSHWAVASFCARPRRTRVLAGQKSSVLSTTVWHSRVTSTV